MRRTGLRVAIAWGLTGAGLLGGAVFGLWGFILDLGVVHHAAGRWGVVGGVVLFPLTYVLVPWYAAIALGNWVPLAIGYGGVIAGAILLWMAFTLS